MSRLSLIVHRGVFSATMATDRMNYSSHVVNGYCVEVVGTIDKEVVNRYPRNQSRSQGKILPRVFETRGEVHYGSTGLAWWRETNKEQPRSLKQKTISRTQGTSSSSGYICPSTTSHGRDFWKRAFCNEHPDTPPQKKVERYVFPVWRAFF